MVEIIDGRYFVFKTLRFVLAKTKQKKLATIHQQLKLKKKKAIKLLCIELCPSKKMLKS